MPSHPGATVSYPLRRAGVMWVVWCLWVLGTGVLWLRWWWLGAARVLGWQVCLLAGLWVLCAGVSWHTLRRWPCRGCLHKEARNWVWRSEKGEIPLGSNPVVLGDIQVLLLLAFTTPSHGVQRFVVCKDWAPDAWGGLRRAVYSSVYPKPDAAATKRP